MWGYHHTRREIRVNVPGTVLLSGIVGSQAYGLATEESDTDRLGIYALPTTAFHGLREPRESVVLTEPSDHTFHEVGKFCRLVLKGNPTVTELLWLPDDLYEVKRGLGDELIRIRGAFLSAPRVRAAYLGYARQQFDCLLKREGTFSSDLKNRTAKHARHLLRLLHQGFGLYSTGHLEIRLEDPTLFHEFGDAVALNPEVAEEQLVAFEARFAQTPPALPKEPDVAPIEAWLQQVRRNFF
jgi:predicted nucleotidyltransferase